MFSFKHLSHSLNWNICKWKRVRDLFKTISLGASATRNRVWRAVRKKLMGIPAVSISGGRALSRGLLTLPYPKALWNDATSTALFLKCSPSSPWRYRGTAFSKGIPIWNTLCAGCTTLHRFQNSVRTGLASSKVFMPPRSRCKSFVLLIDAIKWDGRM